MNKPTQMPDLTTHSTPITVGDAVGELQRVGIPPERIRFNVVKKHPSLGEVFSQEPCPGFDLSMVHDVVLGINSWAGINDARFSFFEADESLAAEQGIDEWQMEDWDDFKSHIVHIFARLDNLKVINHTSLLKTYTMELVIPLQLKEFSRQHGLKNNLNKEDLLKSAQWDMLFCDLLKAAVTPMTSDGLKGLIEKYLKPAVYQVTCEQNSEKWIIRIVTNEEKSQLEVWQVKWLGHLFRPVTVQVEYVWEKKPEEEKIPLKINFQKRVTSLWEKLLLWIRKKWKLLLILALITCMIIALLKIVPWPGREDSRLVNIEFASGSYEIKASYYYVLKKEADYMKAYIEENNHAMVMIEGHTDNIGDELKNKLLSENRAKNIKNYLVQNFGISPNRIEYKGYGEELPIASNDTEAGRKKNRRVVVKYIK
jgi:outer membrane protein OmpA-like peptidoglycan-associated protein